MTTAPEEGSDTGSDSPRANEGSTQVAAFSVEAPGGAAPSAAPEGPQPTPLRRLAGILKGGRRAQHEKRPTTEEAELGPQAEASGAEADAAAAGQARRSRVAFETSVRFVESGETAPLRPESAGGSAAGSSSGAPAMNEWRYSAPWGFQLLDRGWARLSGKGLSLQANRMIVLLLTFLCYTAYHASRKPPSIVKAVLHGDSGAAAGPNWQADAGNASLADRWHEFHWAASHSGSATYSNVSFGGNGTAGNATLGGGEVDRRAGWAPFNNPRTGKSLLGDLDLAFLGAYALGMFVSGHLGDRVDLRYFLTGGMLASGACVCLFGMAALWGIHALPYFIAVQVTGGLFQATGWPSVVSVMANWFGKGKRGLIMGVWNAHTSVGNITGSLIAAYCLRLGWGWSFLVPGAFIAVMGLVIFSLLVVEPQDIGFLPQSGSVLGSEEASEIGTPASEVSAATAMSEGARAYLERHLARLAGRGGGLVPAHVAANMAQHHTIHGGHGKHGLWGLGSTLVLTSEQRNSVDGDSEADLLLGYSPGGLSPGGRSPGGASIGRGSELSTFYPSRRKPKHKGLSLLAAWAIPGVAVFAFTLFFAKLVAYTFLYWLPYYIGTTEVGGRSLSPSEAGQLSILFDVGGVLGGVAAGHLSDASGASALVSAVFVFLAIPFLYLYRAFGEVSFAVNIALMMTAGFFVNGPYALITTAVSADLGTHSSLAGNEKALATVTAIIDGMGSVGAAIGPAVVGYISELRGGFDNVFLMLYGAAACAGALLSGPVVKEVREMLAERRRRRESAALASDGLDGWHPWNGAFGDQAALAPEALTPETVHVDREAFAFLPPGRPDSSTPGRTLDNETGRMVASQKPAGTLPDAPDV